MKNMLLLSANKSIITTQVKEQVILMDRYLAPAGVGEAELIEKRSKFISRVVPVTDESAARAEIAQVKSKHHDANHNCWCYILRDGPERYSDDGEPQGTAGLPMLEVFRRGGINNVCCVVTRYFGGILLGAGGLIRAYSEAAKMALQNAGIAEFLPYERLEIKCNYSLLSRIKAEIENVGGEIENVEYGENVVLAILLQEGLADDLNKRLADASAGSVTGIKLDLFFGKNLI